MAIPLIYPTLPTSVVNGHLASILGGAAELGYLRVTLCGFGPAMPSVPGSAVLADAGVPALYASTVDSDGLAQFSITLWGNDVISPDKTFYEIAVLDSDKNVVSCGMYQFLQGQTYLLSEAIQILPPYGFGIGFLSYLPCTGSGSAWTAPGPVVAVAYNGVMLPMNVAMPTLSYTLDSTGKSITLNFTADPLDRIDAFVIL